MVGFLYEHVLLSENRQVIYGHVTSPFLKVIKFHAVVNVKKHDAHMLETCLSRLRSAEKVTPSTRTWSDTVTVSESICSDRPLLPNDDWPCFEPAHSSSVLSAFSLRRFADIQWLTSSRHYSNRRTVVAISSPKQCQPVRFISLPAFRSNWYLAIMMKKIYALIEGSHNL